MPAAAVIQEGQALFIIIRRKRYVDMYLENFYLKTKIISKNCNIKLSALEVKVIVEVGLKSENIDRKSNGEGFFLQRSIVEVRRSRDQMGLDTPVSLNRQR